MLLKIVCGYDDDELGEQGTGGGGFTLQYAFPQIILLLLSQIRHSFDTPPSYKIGFLYDGNICGQRGVEIGACRAENTRTEGIYESSSSHNPSFNLSPPSNLVSSILHSYDEPLPPPTRAHANARLNLDLP